MIAISYSFLTLVRNFRVFVFTKKKKKETLIYNKILKWTKACHIA